MDQQEPCTECSSGFGSRLDCWCLNVFLFLDPYGLQKAMTSDTASLCSWSEYWRSWDPEAACWLYFLMVEMKASYCYTWAACRCLEVKYMPRVGPWSVHDRWTHVKRLFFTELSPRTDCNNVFAERVADTCFKPCEFWALFLGQWELRKNIKSIQKVLFIFPPSLLL